MKRAVSCGWLQRVVRHRDRHGRGLRGRLLSPVAVINGLDLRIPAARTRSERFDDLVRDAIAELEERWHEQLEGVEFAVEDVPAPDSGWDEGVVADETAGGPVPLGRLLPAHPGIPARVVVYRRPLEARATSRGELSDLVHEVVVDQVAQLLGVDPDVIDPP